MSASGSASRAPGHARGAAVLSVGIGVTGLVTYAYFALANRALSSSDYGGISLLWSAVFLVVSVLYRPVEQLLSRTIADREARGRRGSDHLRVAALIQLGLGALFLVAALALRGPLQGGLFGGSATLYLVFVVTVLAYAVSYFARGFLAGHRRFGLYGGLVLMESVSRCLFALLAALGLASGQGFVAVGLLAAPIVSLAVVPPALRSLGARAGAGRRAATPPAQSDPEPVEPVLEATDVEDASSATGGVRDPEFTLSRGAGFAAAVLLIMLAEQTLLNAGVLVAKLTEGGRAGSALAGVVFNVLLIARAPMQLFQAVQTSILPHLTRLTASGEADPFRQSVHATLAAVAVFAAAVTVGVLAVGPFVMGLVFPLEEGGSYGRGGLALVAVGMGLYLGAATLNQAALARDRAPHAAACWLVTAVGFVAFLLVPGWDDRVLQVEVGFAFAAFVLCGLLLGLYQGAPGAGARGARARSRRRRPPPR